MSRIAFGYQFQTVGSIGPNLINQFGIDYTALGTLVGAFMLLGIFAALPLGLLGRRFGEHLVVGIGLSLMAVGALICTDIGGALGATRAIFAGRCVSGVGAVAMIVLQGKMIADWCHGRQLMMGLGISVSAFPVGVGMAQLIAGMGEIFRRNRSRRPMAGPPRSSSVQRSPPWPRSGLSRPTGRLRSPPRFPGPSHSPADGSA